MYNDVVHTLGKKIENNVNKGGKKKKKERKKKKRREKKKKSHTTTHRNRNRNRKITGSSNFINHYGFKLHQYSNGKNMLYNNSVPRV
jgi:hypothetical protein